MLARGDRVGHVGLGEQRDEGFQFGIHVDHPLGRRRRRSPAIRRASGPDHATIVAYPRGHGGTGRTAVAPGLASRRRDPRRDVLRHADAPAGGSPRARPGLGGPGRVRGRDPAARHGAGDPHVARRHARRPPRRQPRPPRRRSPSTTRRSARCGWNAPARPRPLDEVLLDRLAIAAAAVVERYGPARTTMADPALVELVISADSDEAARARALRLLGFAADLPVRVVAVRSELPLDQVGGLGLPGPPGEGGTARRRGRHPGHHRRPGPVSGRRTRGHRRRREPRPVLAGGPHRPALHHRAPARRPLRRAGRAGAARRRSPRTPCATTPTWPRSPAWPAAPEDLETLDAYCATGSAAPGRGPAPPAPQQRRPPARTDRQDPGHRPHRAHRTDPGQARPHRLAPTGRLNRPSLRWRDSVALWQPGLFRRRPAPVSVEVSPSTRMTMTFVAPVLIGVLFVLVSSLIREPHRRRFNAVMVGRCRRRLPQRRRLRPVGVRLHDRRDLLRLPRPGVVDVHRHQRGSCTPSGTWRITCRATRSSRSPTFPPWAARSATP